MNTSADEQMILLQDSARLAGVSPESLADAIVYVWDRRPMKRISAPEAFITAMRTIESEPVATHRMALAAHLAGRHAAVLIKMVPPK